MAISFSILVTMPAFASIPIVPPFPGSASTTDVNKPSGGDTAHPSVNTSDKQITTANHQTVSSNIAQPVIQSEGALLMEANTGKVLYSKNGNTKYYPASITKLMTALLVAEKCSLNATVTFSKTATTNLESGAVTLGLVEGDKLTVRQCLYGLMLKSANEVANGLAEHVSGSVSNFSTLMNARAKDLGCTNTHFMNPNGLNNSKHYTTPYDMALIARAAFQNTIVKKVCSTLKYQIPATKKTSARTIYMGHKMLNSSNSSYYPGVIGGKTGYTSLAGNTLVTCAEKDGVRLIVVIMKSKRTHYKDTKALLDYGFAVEKENGTTGTTGNSSSNGWKQEGTSWFYIAQDGKKASNKWMKLNGKSYWFDSNGTMATGWRAFTNGSWYYFKEDGSMAVNKWVKSEGKWFYLGGDGAMLKGTTTPDGHQVDETGAWIQ
jgi:D-alanyl-D-alanine carboxypeptidase